MLFLDLINRIVNKLGYLITTAPGLNYVKQTMKFEAETWRYSSFRL